ncbi:uncharacterized protein N7515_003010 [Penicillium bovifimosum]|uniref:Uncharacterized protein n=1 Tax=Penicillium bovifimosum TaxID=126998 RepID=A0A9W9HCM0_9EURO|nr:uncharacterized protein N7515_003010 [Penicillium bovifimosum]KAJ5144223.1 hypothetical protein N7515_003010 [Penicillium bovifimosum]
MDLQLIRQGEASKDKNPGSPSMYLLPVRLSPWDPDEEPEQPAPTQPSPPPTRGHPNIQHEEKRGLRQRYSSVSFMNVIDPRLRGPFAYPVVPQPGTSLASSLAARGPSPVGLCTVTAATQTPNVELTASLKLTRGEIGESVVEVKGLSSLKRVRFNLPEPSQYTTEQPVPTSTGFAIPPSTRRSSSMEASFSSSGSPSKPTIKSVSSPVTPQHPASISTSPLRSGHPVPTSWQSASKSDKMMSLMRQTADATSISWVETVKIWNDHRELGSNEITSIVLRRLWSHMRTQIGAWPGFDDARLEAVHEYMKMNEEAFVQVARDLSMEFGWGISRLVCKARYETLKAMGKISRKGKGRSQREY